MNFCSASFAGNISIGGEGLAFTIPAGYYTILHGEMNKDTEKFLKKQGFSPFFFVSPSHSR